MGDFFKALGDYFRGHKMMMSEGWLKWLMLPGLMALAMIPILFLLCFYLLDPQIWLPMWLQGHFAMGLQIIGTILFTVIGYFAFQPMIMILLSPLYSHLAEQIELKLFGIEPTPLKVSQIMVDLMRGVVMILGMVIVMFSLLAMFWMLSFIPFIGVLFAVFMMPMVQMYFAGMGFADPAMERRHLTVWRRWSFCWQHRFSIMGLGAGFILLSMVPVIGWFLAPGYALFASSINVTEIFHRDDKKSL